MPNKYRFEISCDSSQARQSIRSLIDLLGKADASALKFTQTLGAAFGLAGQPVRKFNADIGQTATFFAHAGQGAARFGQQAVQVANQSATAWRSSFVSVDQLHKSAMDARSKRIEQRQKDDEGVGRRWVAWEKANVHTVEELQMSLLRARSKRIAREQQEEDTFQRRFARALTEREVQQVVANEKMRQSNDKRVQSALRAAGLEETAHGKLVKSMGMMIARFAVYHMAIGKATQLWTAYTSAVHDANVEEEKRIGKFVDERAGLDRLSAQLNRPNDNTLHRDVKTFAADTGLTFEQARDFQLNVAESASQYVAQPGETDAQMKDRGRTVTQDQYNALLKRAAVFARQRGLTDEQTQKMLGTVVGSQDVRAMGNAGVDRLLQRFARPTLILEHGLGPSPVLQGQLAEFHAEFGQGFRSMEDEAIFLSTIAQGRPSGHVHAPARALVQEIESPNKKVKEFLHKVKMANGKRMMRGDEFTGDYSAQEKLEAIQTHFDQLGLTPQQREAMIRQTFGVKTGLSAAVQIFGPKAKAVREERLAFAAQAGTPQAIAAEMARRDNTQDAGLKRQRSETEREEAKRLSGVSGVENLLEREKTRLTKEGRWRTSADLFEREIHRWATFGRADVSDRMVLMREAQKNIMDELQAKAPDALKGYTGFGTFSNARYSELQLRRLMKLRDQALQGQPGFKPLSPQANLSPAGGVKADGEQLALLREIKDAIDRQTQAMHRDHGGQMAMADHGRGLPMIHVPGVQIGMG